VQSNLAGASSSQHIGAWVFKIPEFEEYIMYDNTDYDERRGGGGGGGGGFKKKKKKKKKKKID
jgi:hypothetical protein